MNESQLWGRLEKAVPNADMTRHEDRTRRFIPDVSFGLEGINGWIELKAYDHWPSDGIPKFRNYHPGQKNWLVKRGRAGGHCFALVAVDQYIFLFGWWQIRQLGFWNRDELFCQALTYGLQRIPKDLASRLTRNYQQTEQQHRSTMNFQESAAVIRRPRRLSN